MKRFCCSARKRGPRAIWRSTRLDPLAFTAEPTRTDEARRKAFLMALRVAPNSKFALYVQPDPWARRPQAATPVRHSSADTLPEQHN